MDGGDPNQLSPVPWRLSALLSMVFIKSSTPFYQLQNSFSTGNLFSQGFGLRGPPLHASQAHLGPMSPYQSIIFAPIQNYPDLIAGDITGDEFSDALSTIEPDVIPTELIEPTYQNEGEPPQNTYMNENNLKSQPTSASTFVRGEPIAPPRSRRRSSARSSLASSTVSLNIFGSCASLKECHPVHVGKDPPSRPLRRRDRLRRTAKHLTSIPRNSVELTQIPENEATESQNQNVEVSHIMSLSKTEEPSDFHSTTASISNVKSSFIPLKEKSILAEDFCHSEVSITLAIPPLPLNLPSINSEELVEPIIDSIIRKPMDDNFKIQEEDSDNFQDAEYSSDSSDKNELSICERGEDLLKDIRNMDCTIKNMAREVTKMIKVYDVVSIKGSPTKEHVVIDEPVKVEVIDKYQEDDSGNDYDFFDEDDNNKNTIQREVKIDDNSDYDDIVEFVPEIVTTPGSEDDDDDVTEIVDIKDTLDQGSMGSNAPSLSEIGDIEDYEKMRDERYDELVYKAMKFNWDDVQGENPNGLPPPLLLQEQIRNLKLDLLSSIFQRIYPLEEDLLSINSFISCPASLEEKYNMMRLADILKKNKKSGELLKPEEDRDPSWRSIPVAKEITVVKGIASRAPWEQIQGGTEVLESLGYTEYTGFSLQYPRSVIPDLFADHIGNLTVELVLASVEISTLVVRVSPTMDTLILLQEAEAFPGNEAEEYDSYTEDGGEHQEEPKLITRPYSALVTMNHMNSNDDSDEEDFSVRSLPNLSPDNYYSSSNPFEVISNDYFGPRSSLYRFINELIDKPVPPPRFKRGKSRRLSRSLISLREFQKQVPFVTCMKDWRMFQASFSNPNSQPAQHHTHQRRSMIFMEGEYEEIGPGSPVMRSNSTRSNGKISNHHLSRPLCDLCGRNPALIRCQYCSGQIFCMSCDDTYHKHPKRAVHTRKALNASPMIPSGAAPTLPPKNKGISPIAPPRRNSRKSSLPDASRLTRSSTLPRKGSIPIAGRPITPTTTSGAITRKRIQQHRSPSSTPSSKLPPYSKPTT
ncbi:RNF31 [Lepeophtheirus salmonis]|uniref:RNF31 n=1 Tax=Lepeophtheirus salmonis TaxID=72036 RepID=A0A7R8HDN8_LEPSM|nr:RNF31 [Lepeophtheirus salmonis]CAF3033974.1 RNF31 [Lepeophtheirus salmonis]